MLDDGAGDCNGATRSAARKPSPLEQSAFPQYSDCRTVRSCDQPGLASSDERGAAATLSVSTASPSRSHRLSSTASSRATSMHQSPLSATVSAETAESA